RRAVLGGGRSGPLATPRSRGAPRQTAFTFCPSAWVLRPRRSGGRPRRRSPPSTFAVASIFCRSASWRSSLAGSATCPALPRPPCCSPFFKASSRAAPIPRSPRSPRSYSLAPFFFCDRRACSRGTPDEQARYDQSSDLRAVRRLHAVRSLVSAHIHQPVLGQRHHRDPDLVPVRRKRESAVRLRRATVVRSGALFWLRDVRRRDRHRPASPDVLASLWARSRCGCGDGASFGRVRGAADLALFRDHHGRLFADFLFHRRAREAANRRG